MSNVQIALRDGANAALSDETIRDFRTAMRGALITPSDVNYDEARKVYNAMIDKHPALIAQCADTADVIAAINFGRKNHLTIAVRGGGHNGAGLGICDDGLVVDLSRMKGIRVDPQQHTVRVEGGCTWGDVDHAAHPFGLAVPTGIISTTGVGGLTLGGGLGYLTRRYGLTIDNLLSLLLTPMKTRICSGRCVAVAATSVSLPRSSFRVARSARFMVVPSSGPLNRQRR